MFSCTECILPPASRARFSFTSHCFFFPLKMSQSFFQSICFVFRVALVCLHLFIRFFSLAFDHFEFVTFFRPVERRKRNQFLHGFLVHAAVGEFDFLYFLQILDCFQLNLELPSYLPIIITGENAFARAFVHTHRSTRARGSPGLETRVALPRRAVDPRFCLSSGIVCLHIIRVVRSSFIPLHRFRLGRLPTRSLSGRTRTKCIHDSRLSFSNLGWKFPLFLTSLAGIFFRYFCIALGAKEFDLLEYFFKKFVSGMEEKKVKLSLAKQRCSHVQWSLHTWLAQLPSIGFQIFIEFYIRCKYSTWWSSSWWWWWWWWW